MCLLCLPPLTIPLCEKKVAGAPSSLTIPLGNKVMIFCSGNRHVSITTILWVSQSPGAGQATSNSNVSQSNPSPCVYQLLPSVHTERGQAPSILGLTWPSDRMPLSP